MKLPNMTRLGQHVIPILFHILNVTSFTTGCVILYLCTADKTFFELRSFVNFAL